MNLYPPRVVIPIYLIFTGIGIALTATRYYVRIVRLRAGLGADDYLVAFGAVIVAACTSIQVYNSLHGTGGDAVSEDDAVRQAETAYKVDFTMMFIEKPGFSAIKLSFLFFYKRIFDVWPSFHRANTVAIWVVIVWVLAFSLADLLICGGDLGVQFSANQSLAGEKCGDKGILLLAFGLTSVLTDLMVLSLPFFFLPRLQMPARKKWAASGVFLLGFSSTLAAVLRTVFLAVAYPTGRMSWGYKPPPDGQTPLVLRAFNPTFFVLLELYLGLWAANLPPLGPILGSVRIGSVRLGSAVSSAYSSIHRKMSVATSTRRGSQQKPVLSSTSSAIQMQDTGNGLSVDSQTRLALPVRETNPSTPGLAF